MLHYSPDTGVFVWRVRPNGRVAPGDAAGSICHLGYRRIQVDGRVYLAHRLAWLYCHGRWPALHIDHIDMDRDNNALANLREATRSQNQANTKTPRGNRLGVKGVQWAPDVGKYRVRVSVLGVRRTVGYYETVDEAGAAYRAAAVETFGEFARAG